MPANLLRHVSVASLILGISTSIGCPLKKSIHKRTFGDITCLAKVSPVLAIYNNTIPLKLNPTAAVIAV